MPDTEVEIEVDDETWDLILGLAGDAGLTPEDIIRNALAVMVENDWCYSHNRPEPSNNDTYLTCFECNHVFQTEGDLEQSWVAEMPDSSPLEADDIPFCPVCGHDF